jgi:photosystem II stability/assembly factor-like uncharacterized protein
MYFAFSQKGYLVATALLFFALASNTLAAGRWTQQKSNTLAWLHAVYFLNENKGWVAGSNGTLLATDDGGENWRTLKRPTEDNLLDAVFLNEQTGWLLCESYPYQLQSNEPRTYLLFTTDGGTKWRRIFLEGYTKDLRVTRIIFSKENKGWLFGENGTFYTTEDGGSNWIGKPAPSRFLLLGGTMTDSQHGVLVGAGSTIVYTFDGGLTWRTGTVKDNKITSFRTTSKANNEPVRIRFTSVSFVDSERGWAVGYSGKIFITNDGGKNWFAQESNVTSDLYDVKFLNGKEGWAVGDSGTLLYTNNRGYLWESINVGMTHKLERIFFVTPERGFAVGFGGTILSYSTDNKNPQLKAAKKIND